MSKADKILFSLGYIKKIDNEDTVLYVFEKERWKKSIYFRKDINTISTHCNIFVPKNIEQWKAMEFKTEWLKYCSAQGHWEPVDMEITLEELKAINTKVKELGWEE